MTCIVGIVDTKNNRVVMGADSAGVAEDLVTPRKDTKIFKTGDFLIGCTSSFRMIQLLRFSLKVPEISEDKDIYEYMCTDFINAVRECFKDGGFSQKYKDGDEKGGTFLVAYKDRLFKIENDMQVGESLRGYDAVGCGECYALGSIRALLAEPYLYNSINGASDLETLDLRVPDLESYICVEALKSAEEFSTGVGGPFKIMCT